MTPTKHKSIMDTLTPEQRIVIAQFIQARGRVLLREQYYHGPLGANGIIDLLADEIKSLPDDKK